MSTRRRKPINHQIADQLRQRIGGGEYSDGLPPEITLMAEFNVSRHTMRSALQRLVVDGLIERRPGRGTTVSKWVGSGGPWVIGSLDDLIGEFSIQDSILVRSGFVAAREMPGSAKLFGLLRSGSLFHLMRILVGEQGPYAVSNLFTPVEYAARLPKEELGKKSLIALIEEHCRVRGTHAQQIASAGEATAEIAERLGLEAGQPVLILQRTYFSSDGETLVYAELMCRSDRYRQTANFFREPTAPKASRLDQANDAAFLGDGLPPTAGRPSRPGRSHGE